MSQERWFDDECSECYLGMGHQDADEFAWWVLENEVNEFGATLQEARDWISPTRVEHVWARWIDDEPHERMTFCASDTVGSFAITRLEL